MLSANSYSMSWAAAGNMSALSMPCSSIRARRRSRLPNASDLWRNSAMNSLRCSSSNPLSGLSRLSSMPGMARMSTSSSGSVEVAVSNEGIAERPMPMLEVSPKQLLELVFREGHVT